MALNGVGHSRPYAAFLVGLLALMPSRDARAQSPSPADGPWSGEAQCVIATTSAGYHEEQTHTFTVPVKLTRLSTGVSRVRVSCSILSEAMTVNCQDASKGETRFPTGPGMISVQQEFPVTGGEVIATATLVPPTAGVLDDPLGKQASYSCRLEGYSVAQQRFVPFNDAFPIEGTEPALRVAAPGSQPAPLQLSGTFTW